MAEVQVCRTCLRVIEKHSNFVNLDASDSNPVAFEIKEKLDACVPELTIDIVKTPVICGECIVSLDAAYAFKRKCLDTESEIYEYYMTDSDNKAIDLQFIAKRNIQAEVRLNVQIGDGFADSVSANEINNRESKVTEDQIQSAVCYPIHVKQEPHVDEENHQAENLHPIYYLKERNSEEIEVMNQTPNLILPPCFVILNRLSEDVLKSIENQNRQLTSDKSRSASLVNKSTLQYLCCACEKPFKDKQKLLNHLYFHKPQNMFVMCYPYNSSTAQPMKMHLYKKKSGKEKRYQCGVCNIFISKINQHLEVHTGETTARKDKLASSNKRTHASMNPKTIRGQTKKHELRTFYKCRLCRFSAASAKKLQIHLKTHAEVNSGNSSENPQIDFATNQGHETDTSYKESNLRSHEETLLVDVNPKILRVRNNQPAHLEKDTGLNKKSSVGLPADHKSKNRKTKKSIQTNFCLKCGHCRYKTTVISQLSDHIKSHSKGKTVKCGKCNFTIDRMDRLECHVRIHVNEKLYLCMLCDYQTYSRSEFSNHRKIHCESTTCTSEDSPEKAAPSKEGTDFEM